LPALSLSLSLLTGRPADIAAVQSVLAAAPGYFRATTGRPPGDDEAQRLFAELPPGRSDADKRVWGLVADGATIGCADVVRGWNAPDKAIIGLLLLAEPWQGRGLGRAFAARVEEAIAAWPEVGTIRLGVVAGHDRALRFWRRCGYRETGEVKPATPPLVAAVVVLEKPLQRSR
jgi:GNAT superfamily N-acetyltransferase